MVETTRRRFLGMGAAIVGGAAASRSLAEGGQPTGAAEKLTNWAGNYEYSVDRIHEARTAGEGQGSSHPVRVVHRSPPAGLSAGAPPPADRKTAYLKPSSRCR
jgi:hypothetical protein